MNNTDKSDNKNKISRITVVEQISDAIKQNIIDQVWTIGSKLPSEGELAEYFGVNRLSIRMALKKLNTLGMLETRIGEGTYVKEFSLQPYFEEISVVYSNSERMKDVEQFRNLLEGECMYLAIINADQEMLSFLKSKLDDYHIKKDILHKDIDNEEYLDNMVDADLAFHYEIIKMSKNKLYMDMYQMLQQLIRSHIRELVYRRIHKAHAQGKLSSNRTDNHDLMYNSIINGDIEAAKSSRELVLGIVPIHGLDYFVNYPAKSNND